MKLPRAIFLFIIPLSLCAQESGQGGFDFSNVPGVVVSHIPASERVYTCSPSLLLMPDGSYIAAHSRVSNGKRFLDAFPASIFKSVDKGKSWTHLSDVQMNTPELFLHKGELYYIGTIKRAGNLVIRKSIDGGKTWTVPADEKTGILKRTGKNKKGETIWVPTTPSPVIKHDGKIWFTAQARLMWASEDSDLLDAKSWTFSGQVILPESMRSAAIDSIMEYNVVYDRKKDKMCLMGRLNGIVDDIGLLVYFDENWNPEPASKWFIRFPGAGKKFTIRYDEKEQKYYSLTNWVPETYRFVRYPKSAFYNVNSLIRNTLVLIESKNLRDWKIKSVILQGTDVEHQAFQYVHFDIEGDDIVFLSRTAWFDGVSEAKNMHDSNFITFHRIENFRSRTLESPPLNGDGKINW